MPYVNFKEENYKLEKQISKRKENNKKIRSKRDWETFKREFNKRI